MKHIGEIIPLSLSQSQPIQWLKYVPHSSLCEYLSKGWEIADELHGTNHGAYAVLMVFKGEGEPK